MKLPATPSLWTPEVRRQLRHAYDLAVPKPASCVSHAVLHIRMGDVKTFVENDARNPTHWSERYLNIPFYEKFVKAIKQKHPEWMITIVSRGKASEFGELQSIPGC